MSVQSTTQWFAEPLDDFSNTVIARLVHADETEMQIFIVTDTDGHTHNAWLIESWSQIKYLQSSSQNIALRFNIWERQNKEGRVRKAVRFAQQYPNRGKKPSRKSKLIVASRL